MRNKLWRAILPTLYLIWAFYTLDVPDMPNPHAADISALGLWAFLSSNLLAGVLFVGLVQICWHMRMWFFSPTFQQLSTAGFFTLVVAILLAGVAQWLGIAWFVAGLYRRLRKSRDSEVTTE
jgi:hypothetical protein